VKPGTFCVIYGGILGAPGISLSANGKVPSNVGEDFYQAIAQTNPADDPYTISQSAASTAVHTSGPKDKFTLTVTHGAAQIEGDPTIFVTEVYSEYWSCGYENPLAPPGDLTGPSNPNGTAYLNYEPSPTVGTCKVTAQEADTGSTSNVVTIHQSN
jgi:hypothetical protein